MLRPARLGAAGLLLLAVVRLPWLLARAALLPGPLLVQLLLRPRLLCAGLLSGLLCG
jgi:hypothetical protein